MNPQETDQQNRTETVLCESRETGEQTRLPKHFTFRDRLFEDSLPYVLNNYFNEIRVLDVDRSVLGYGGGEIQERMLLVNMKKPYFVGNAVRRPPDNDYEWEVMPIMMKFPVLSSSFFPEYDTDVYRIANLLNSENLCGYVKAADGKMQISETITRVEVQQTLNRMWSEARPLHAFKQHRLWNDMGKWCNARDGDHTDVGDVLEEFELRLIREVGLSKKLLQHLQKIFKRQCKLDTLTFDDYCPDLSVIKETTASKGNLHRYHMNVEVYVLPEHGDVYRGFIPCEGGESHGNTYNIVLNMRELHNESFHLPDVQGVPRSRLRSKSVGDAALREAKRKYELSLPLREPPTRYWAYNRPYFYYKTLEERTFEEEARQRKRRRLHW